MTTLTYDDYLRLTGLLALAADHRRQLQAIERSACALTGQQIEAGGHTSDAVWVDGYDVQRLLRLLSIPVPPAPPAPTAAAMLADIERQAAGAMRVIGHIKELFPEE